MLPGEADAVGAMRVEAYQALNLLGKNTGYANTGFTRSPELDWEPVPGIDLLGFALPLRQQGFSFTDCSRRPAR